MNGILPRIRKVGEKFRGGLITKYDKGIFELQKIRTGGRISGFPILILSQVLDPGVESRFDMRAPEKLLCECFLSCRSPDEASKIDDIKR